jgi:ornithine cyclodeaminase
VNLGDIVCGRAKGGKSDDEIIMFLTGGMPLHDIAWGKTLYDNAMKKGLGTEFLFFGEAHWK